MDNDLAIAELKYGNLASVGNYELWLGVGSGLKIYANASKALFTTTGGGKTVDRIESLGGDTWYIFKKGGTSPPRRVFVEGVAVGKSAAQDVFWRLNTNPGGTPSFTVRDTVMIPVEDIVWPFQTQTANWQNSNTSQWVGLDLADAWYINKALVDYIVNPNDKGIIETIHPDLDNGKRASADGLDSSSTKTYGNNVTLSFDYEFELRGGNEYGYVQADLTNYGNADARNHNLDRVKVSFVGNSGIKFASTEINILDVDSMVALAGGLGAFTKDPTKPLGPKGIDDQGNVDILRNVLGGMHDFEDEGLTKLMTGVRYGDTTYSRFSDFSAMPSQSSDFISALQSNMNRTDGHMQIIFSGASLTVKLNGETIYFDPAANLSLGKFDLQSHWGSGVKFTNMDVQ